ncbi:hypothetical protein ACIQ4I_12230 [Rummeliibacillus sp. NPDC094406]|uniref:hypothetical protein n=1 Tax=Rummeliibacillus sp. NPDC094406 TaxID=3364511 RepID=UPI0038245AF0
MKNVYKSIFAFAIIFASIILLYTDTAIAKTSYMRDKNKIYYGIDSAMPFTEKYVKTKNGYRITYFNKSEDMDGYYNWQKETKTGLYLKTVEEPMKLLPYPIKLGKTWEVFGEVNRIIDTDATVKIKAGTFKHVVVARDNSTENINKDIYCIKSYYAPNAGKIKEELIENNQIYTIYELTKIKTIKK